MAVINNYASQLSRRDALSMTSCGFGYLALRGLLADDLKAASFSNPLSEKSPHFQPKAKRVIFMFMQGGPSHLETFDHKPELEKSGDKKIGGKPLLAPVFKFNPHGKSGLMISDVYPHLAKHADKLCLLNGMHTSSPAHPQASIALHTGSQNFVRPSMGAWITYGLGTVNQDLPGFVTINPLDRLGGAQNYGSAFLPASYQGTKLSVGNAMANIKNTNLSKPEQRRQIDLVQSMNRRMLDRVGANSEIEGVIQSYELAYRMQSAVPTVMDLKKENQKTREMYGLDNKVTSNFGTQCLMARRLAESGVRFIQVTHNGWDQHNSLSTKLKNNALATDRPIAALMSDLKDRGMLKDTLLIWGGEFGRTPEAQNKDGRRHNNRGYSMWIAGGGVKGGIRYGSTDPLGDTAVSDKMHTHDLHATVLHLLGLDHTKLTYRYAGRDFRLTDVYGEVAQKIIA
jgi:hypothetical protein